VQDGSPNSSGTWVSAPIASNITEFTATFRFSFRNSVGGPGDGFSFLWGNLSNASGTRMSGGEGGVQAFVQDQSGLSVGFASYPGAGANGVNGKWAGGSNFAFVPFTYTPVTWTTTALAANTIRMATATVFWSRNTGTRVTIAVPGNTGTLIYIDKGQPQTAAVNSAGWSNHDGNLSKGKGNRNVSKGERGDTKSTAPQTNKLRTMVPDTITPHAGLPAQFH
jgi:hypothetical protein